MDDLKLEEKCLTQEIIYKGKIFCVNKDTVLLPDGKTAPREIIHHPGAVAIVACTEGKILMVRQYRYALKRETLEIPAGKLELGEKPEVCAHRELREETGYDGSLSFLGVYYSSPGFTDEAIYLYLAEDLFWSPLKADEDEFLRVSALAWTEAVDLISKGKIQDGKSVLGILLAQKKVK